MGVMAITGVYSTWVIGGAAIFAHPLFFHRKDCGAHPCHSDSGHGRRLHPLVRLHRRIGAAHAGRKKVDYTRSKNLILTAVTMISGLSGATIVLGPVQLKGMGLATVVAMIMSCVFLFFEKIHWANEG